MDEKEKKVKKPYFWSASNEEKLKQSPCEILKHVKISPIEQEALDRVFEWLIRKDDNKPKEQQEKIGPGDILNVLNFLGLRPLKSEVEFIIWEVDDDLDGYVSKDEYLTMYKRVITDEVGLEPRQLYNLVQFLMFDKDFEGTITVEETLQLIYVRHGKDKMGDEITNLFGEQDKIDSDYTEKHITYKEFMVKTQKRDLQKHKEYMKKIKGRDLKGAGNENEDD